MVQLFLEFCPELQLDLTSRSPDAFYLYVVMESHQSKTTMIRLTGSHGNIQIKPIILYQKRPGLHSEPKELHPSTLLDKTKTASQISSVRMFCD